MKLGQAVGVVGALALAGHLSDWYGRKRLLIPAAALTVVSAIVFLVWKAVPGLLVARVLTGISIPRSHDRLVRWQPAVRRRRVSPRFTSGHPDVTLGRGGLVAASRRRQSGATMRRALPIAAVAVGPRLRNGLAWATDVRRAVELPLVAYGDGRLAASHHPLDPRADEPAR